MRTDAEEPLENLAYALKCVLEVAARRKNRTALMLCEKLRKEMGSTDAGTPDTVRRLQNMTRRLDWTARDLLKAMKFEMREVLIPFIEVNRPTHAFGVQMFPAYFQWLSEEKTYTPGELAAILEDNMETLLVAREHIIKARHCQSLLQGR